jgi:hypothetical protein
MGNILRTHNGDIFGTKKQKMGKFFEKKKKKLNPPPPPPPPLTQKKKLGLHELVA